MTFGQVLTKFVPFFSDENKSGRKQRINATCKSWPIFLYEQVSLRHFMFSEPSLMIVCDHEWTFLDNSISFSSFCGNHLILSTHLKGTSLFKLMVSKTEQDTLQPRWRDGIFSFLFPRQNNDHFTGWGGEVVTFTSASNHFRWFSTGYRHRPGVAIWSKVFEKNSCNYIELLLAKAGKKMH